MQILQRKLLSSTALRVILLLIFGSSLAQKATAQSGAPEIEQDGVQETEVIELRPDEAQVTENQFIFGLFNLTEAELDEFYISPSSSESLGSNLLQSGNAIQRDYFDLNEAYYDVSLSRQPGECIYDVWAIFADESEIFDLETNLCETVNQDGALFLFEQDRYSTSSNDPQETLDIINDTNDVLIFFFAASTDSSENQRDLLGNSVLSPGEVFAVNNVTKCGLTYTFEAQFESGSDLRSEVAEDFNICEQDFLLLSEISGTQGQRPPLMLAVNNNTRFILTELYVTSAQADWGVDRLPQPLGPNLSETVFIPQLSAEGCENYDILALFADDSGDTVEEKEVEEYEINLCTSPTPINFSETTGVRLQSSFD